MKTTLSIILLLLLITSTLPAAVTSEQKVNTPSGNTVNGSSAGNATKDATKKPHVTSHKITSSELETLKAEIGVYEDNQNYSQQVDGYGTGMLPPTNSEWDALSESLYTIDSVDYTDGGPILSVDQSATPWFPPIGSQGSQGSCVTWAVGYYIKTFQEAKEHGWDLSGASWEGGHTGHPTESYQDKIMSPAFIYNLINHGTDGGSSYHDAIDLVCFVGDCSWEKMPYNPSTYTTWPSEEAWTEAAFYRGNSSGFQYMNVNTEAGLTNLKNLIASGCLATISVDAYKYDVLTSTDLWTLDNYNDFDTNHANTIIGYDDTINYTENGEVHYGAFKVANSWGVGYWENVPDGFYWISYEAMKQRVGYCMFYYDMIDYEPKVLASFEINHLKRNECNIRVGLGTPDETITTKSFSNYVNGGAVPFPENSIVLDITEFADYVTTVYGQPFYLRVYDGGTSTIGEVTSFTVEQEESADAPCPTNSSSPVYLTVTPPILNQILINTNAGPSTPNQKVPVGAQVNLFFTQSEWFSGQFRLHLSTENLSEVSTSDVVYTPLFDVDDLTASAVTPYASASGAWQIGFNWVNGTVPTYITGGEYYFKASADLSTFVLVSDTSIVLTGTLQLTPTAGSASTAVMLEGYGFSANHTADITYLNPITSTWVSIVNDTLTDTEGHFTYATVASDLLQVQPAGDNSALFDSIIFRARDNNSGEYYNATAPFNEFRRGLTQVGSAVASGLYGNNTDLTSTVEVVSGNLLTVAGEWFATGTAVISWDDTYLDTATIDSTGSFIKTVTVPTAEAGTHTITVSNETTKLLFTITTSPTPTPTPSEPDEQPTTNPTPSPSPSSSPSPSPSPTPSPAPSPPPTVTPTPSPQSTPSSTPPPEQQIFLYVISAASVLALIGVATIILKK